MTRPAVFACSAYTYKAARLPGYTYSEGPAARLYIQCGLSLRLYERAFFLLATMHRSCYLRCSLIGLSTTLFCHSPSILYCLILLCVSSRKCSTMKLCLNSWRYNHSYIPRRVLYWSRPKLMNISPKPKYASLKTPPLAKNQKNREPVCLLEGDVHINLSVHF